VTKAFGDDAALVQRTHVVLAKGVPVATLEGTGEAILAGLREENRMPGIVRFRRWPGKVHVGATRTMLLVEVSSSQAADSLCEKGLVWKAGIWTCEPFSAELRPVQCFRCYQWGHTARRCTKAARCPLYAATVHDKEDPRRGEELCPVSRGNMEPCCINCHMKHPAFHPRCRAAKEHWETAKAAYETRPRRFALGGGSAAQANEGPVAEPGWLTVVPKKRRLAPSGASTAPPATPPPGQAPRRAGRPLGLATAGWANRSTIDRHFGPGSRADRETSIIDISSQETHGDSQISLM
jgi:hypothetical protein